MIRFLFALIAVFILIFLSQKILNHFRFFCLRKKIKNNPLIGVRQEDGSYYYKERGYAADYKVKNLPAGNKEVEWLFLKHRPTFLGRRIINAKRGLNKFFLYQRWAILFRPLVLFFLVASIIIFYGQIREHSFKRIGYFKWIISQMTSIGPESIEYKGKGLFTITGQKTSAQRDVSPINISFNPLRSLFFSDTAKVSLWSQELKGYISYPVTVTDKGDVWLDKRGGLVHGRVTGDKIVWDEPQRAGIREEVSGHRITIEDGKLEILDE